MTIKIPRHKDSLTFKRSELPQIRSDHMQDFIHHLGTQGVGVKRHRVEPSKLRATQSEFNVEKVKGMMGKKDLSDKPSLTSRDGYILDGHHRWLVDHNKKTSHHTVQVDLPIHDLIAKAHAYDKSFTKSISEQRNEVLRRVINEAATHAYGWLNDKGSFVRNRKGKIHGMTYKKFRPEAPDPKVDYDETINHALEKGWTRLDIEHEKRPAVPEKGMKARESLTGVVNYKRGKVTPRHKKGLQRVLKALGRGGSSKIPYDVVHIAEEAHGWIDPEGKWQSVPKGKIHADVYLAHLKVKNPQEHEKIIRGADHRQATGMAIRHAKKHGWLHTYIDSDGYGMISGQKKALDTHKKAIEGLKSRYRKPDVTLIHEVERELPGLSIFRG
jgi:hypothetical protein